MALKDRKITDWTQPVTSLDDRPQMAAAALKAAFDSNSNQLKPALNGAIDDLTGTGGAGNIGVAAIAGVTGTTVQAMLAALKALIDLCDTSAESDDKLNLKADKTTTDKLVKTITLNADTGVFTIKTDDGTTTTIDTMLEKIPVNCYLDGQEFVLVLDDGTEQRADLSDFITGTEFTDSSTIDFSVTGSNVTATIKNGSITLSMLENTVMSTLQGYMTAAQTAASNASTSETNAGAYRDQAQESATAAASSASEAGAKSTLSESWAIGGTGTRQGEDTNNSKYFAQQSANSAATAQGWSDSAMEQADAAAQSASDAAQSAADAEAISGGDFIPNSRKGVPNGVATLDSSGKLPAAQKPAYTASEVGAVPTTRTVNGKELSADVTLTGDDIKTSASDNTPIGDVVSVLGGATTPQGALAALGAGVRPSLVDNGIFVGVNLPVNQRGDTSWTTSGYHIDRWKHIQNTDDFPGSSVSGSIQSDGLHIGSGGIFEQPIEPDVLDCLAGKQITVSALVKAIGFGTFTTTVNTSGSYGSVVGSGGCSISIDYTNNNFKISNEMSSEIIVKGVKIEEGDTQTLAYQDEDGAWQLLPQPESDYATQLAKCQRYLLLSIAGDYRASYISTNAIIFVVPIPVTMRVSPTRIGDFLVKTITGSTQTGFAFSIAARSGCIRISATKTAHGLTDAILNIQSNVDGFTAEL